MALADLPVSYVEIGKIKIGRKGEARQSQRGSTWHPPEKLDHFVITTLFRGADENFVVDEGLMESLRDFRDADGKLRSIPVMFGSNNIEEVMQTSYTWYVGRTCGARTDGETITFYADPKTGKLLDRPAVYKWHPDYLTIPDPTSRTPKPMLKRFTTLNCMIASPAARFGGFYRFRTTSEITSRQLYGSLMHFCGPRGLCPGVLRGLPFRLVVRPMPVSPMVNGKATPTIVQVCHVEYMHSDLKALQAAAAEQRKLELEGVQMVLQADQQYRQLLAAQREESLIDDDDLVDPDELPMLPMPGKAPSDADRAQQAIQEQAAVLEAIDKGIAAAKSVDELRAFWQSTIKPNWRKLDSAQQAAVTDAWGKRKTAIENPPPAATDVEVVQDAEVIGGDGPDEPGPDEPGAEPTKKPEEPVAPIETAAANPNPPLRAGKAIINEIIRLLNGRPYEELRAAHQKELGITAGRMADLTADQALGLIAKLQEGGVS